jgi:hypothetical protein
VALGSAGVLAAIVQIALGHDAKGTDGGEHGAFSAVNLVHAIAFSDWLALTPPGQVQIPREHIARIAIGIAVLLTCAASTAEVAIPSVTIALTCRGYRTDPTCRRLDFLQTVASDSVASGPLCRV